MIKFDFWRTEFELSPFLKACKEIRSFKGMMNCLFFALSAHGYKNMCYNDWYERCRLTYGRTSVYNLNYHLIWGTKYRNKVLKGHVEAVLKKTLYEIASKYGFTIAHMEIGKDDHIHLLVSVP